MLEIEKIGSIVSSPMEAAHHRQVRKHGRTTLLTDGVIMDISGDFTVYYHGKPIIFKDQLAIDGVKGNFAWHGDSGALIVDAASSRPVGLLFAIASGTTIAHKIAPVLKHFNVRIAQ